MKINLVVFLAAWARGLWISPAGPVIVGIYWLPMIYVSVYKKGVLWTLA